MKKLKIEIPLILPEVPNEKDQCVQELISLLQEQKGLEKVHVLEAADKGVPQLCFHYNPELISIDRPTNWCVHYRKNRTQAHRSRRHPPFSPSAQYRAQS